MDVRGIVDLEGVLSSNRSRYMPGSTVAIQTENPVLNLIARNLPLTLPAPRWDKLRLCVELVYDTLCNRDLSLDAMGSRIPA